MANPQDTSKTNPSTGEATPVGEKEGQTTSNSSAADSARSAQPAAAFRAMLPTDHTPPTMMIRDGSLVFELPREFSAAVNSGVAARPIRLTTSFVILQMRVADGSFNVRYTTHDADGCQISIWLQDPATHRDEQVLIQNVGDRLQVDVDQNFLPAQDGDDRDRPFVYRHPGFGRANPFNIKKVIVRKGGDILYTGLEELNDMRTRPKSIYILLWDRA